MWDPSLLWPRWRLLTLFCLPGAPWGAPKWGSAFLLLPTASSALVPARSEMGLRVECCDFTLIWSRGAGVGMTPVRGMFKCHNADLTLSPALDTAQYRFSAVRTVKIPLMVFPRVGVSHSFLSLYFGYVFIWDQVFAETSEIRRFLPVCRVSQ